jgi:hypothetical protein
MQEVSGVPPVLFEGQGGLMDVIIHSAIRKKQTGLFILFQCQRNLIQ